MRTLFLLALLFPLAGKAQQNKGIGEKSTSTPLRCVGISMSMWSGSEYQFYDSTVFIYTGSRTSNFDAPDLNSYINFDSCLNYTYDATTHSYLNTTRVLQSFDSYDNIQAKSSKIWNSDSSSWQQGWEHQHLFTYDAANRILDDVTQTWDTATSAWLNAAKLLSTYDGSGKLTSLLRKRWNTATSLWVDENRDSYTYDASGKLAVDSIEAVSGGWVNFLKRTFTYDAGNLISDQYQQWSPSGWENSTITTYSSYTADVPRLVVYTQWNTSTSAYDTVARKTFTYNSYGQPELVTFQNWSPTSFFVNYWKARYYYNYPAATPNMISNENTISIYPVPAEQTLNVVVEWTEPQPFTVSIYDIAGKLHNSWDISSCAKHTQAIPVSDLAPGNYIIHLQGTHSSESRQITIK